MTSQQPELTWKRQPRGGYVARHGFWVYTVFRTDMAPQGRQWILEGYPEGNPTDVQQRKGFSNMSLAKMAALHSNCFRCGRSRPFGTLESYHENRRGEITTWRCRDRESCEAEHDRLMAAEHPVAYEATLRDIREAKAKVREMESLALTLRAKALATGTPEAEIERIEREVAGREVAEA